MFSRMDMFGFWQRAEINPSRIPEARHLADLIMKFKPMYDPVSAKTNVPWWVIGAIDDREESFRHTRYLGNGDPLAEKTIHVPKNRGPFLGENAWSDGAIDAIHISGWDILPGNSHWDIVTCLMKSEAYNGEGYAHRGLRSPYLWGATNMQQKGKYTSDGHWDGNAWDTQVGVAALYLALKEFHGVNLNEA